MADRKMNAEINVEFKEAATRQSLNSGDSVNTLFGKIKKFFSDLKPVAFSGDAETVNGHTVESNIPALGYYYATCDSPLTTNIKTVTCKGFEFKEGARITICFTTSNGGTPPSTSTFILKINNDTGRPIAYNDWRGKGTLTLIQSQKSEAFCSNQVWDFIFINGRFIMQAPLRGYQMDTVLSNSSSSPVENKVIKAELDKKANIDDIPTSLPANGGNADTVGGHTVLSNVPANAKFTDTVQDLSGYAKKTDIPTSLPANGGNADTVDNLHASAFLGGEFVYKSYLEGGNSSNLNDYVTDYHGFVYNCTNTPNPNEYGFLDVSNFYGGGFVPSLPEKGGVIRQIFTSYSTGKAYLRLRIQNVWGNWKCFADGGDSATVNGRAAWRIPTIDQNGNQWDDSAPNINDMYAQWDSSKKWFKLKTLGGNNIAVDVATSNIASGTITGLANGVAKTASLPFSPVFVLFHSNGHVVQGGFALSCGTNSFTITPANVSTMGSTAVGYIAFGG